ncbi:MAG: diphosphokinase / guanosine-3,5-bis(diphosphate) 3-diphosphatase, partial [Actinomycetota bacterium]|nr:diphosphokinase / guanosine-3,5-bis(diphosphate) 3-diphosphatase [Actinomycetota bacterium]
MKTALPRRRHHRQVDSVLQPLVDRFQVRHPKSDTSLIEHAYEVARDAHHDQVRRSGDAYITHPVGVALVLADLGLDDVTIAAALLHDAVEDTPVTLGDLEDDFGADVAGIVDGVTKLDRI